MFPTGKVDAVYGLPEIIPSGRNPLKSGQCFLRKAEIKVADFKERRNPLKSGQCFLPGSFLGNLLSIPRRNPLKSGQCFLPPTGMMTQGWNALSQSPQIGSMFPTCIITLFNIIYKISSMSQSPQIGSMFPTVPIFFYAL